MTNRHRERVKINEPSYYDSGASLTVKKASTVFDPIMQMHHEGPITVVDYSLPAEQLSYNTGGPFGDSSEIDDESTVGYGLKDVSHVKRELPSWPRLDFVSPSNWAQWKTSYYGNWKSSPNYYYSASCQPWIQLGNACFAKGAHNLQSFSVGEIQWPDTPPDRLAELPDKVLRAIEKLHSGNIAYEARDLPELWKLFQQRERFYRNLKLLVSNPRFLALKLKGGPRTAVLEGIRSGLLAYHYGIAPTIGDLSKIIREVKLARKGKNKQPKGFSISIRGASGRLDPYYDAGFDYPWEPPVSFRQGSIREELKVVRVDGCRVSIVKDDLRSLSGEWLDRAEDTVSRYVGSNPVGLAWESFPFSFMLDWVFNIDGVLDNLFLWKNSRIQTEYWTSTKASLRQEWKLQVCKDIYGDYPEINRRWDSSGPVVRTLSHYVRGKREQPSPLDAVRLTDMNAGSKLFWTCLIALGIAQPR